MQGRYGLAADQLVEASVVLADSSALLVSEQRHSDLFWALRGAGHNFGIVTEMKYKIHDVPDNNTWTFVEMNFGINQTKELFEAMNTLSRYGTQSLPVNSFVISTLMWNTDVDTQNVSARARKVVLTLTCPFSRLL